MENSSSQDYVLMITAIHGGGNSVLETLLKRQGIPFVAGPMHIDGAEDFAEAARAAHNIQSCFPLLHDVVLDATTKSLSNEQLYALLSTLPNSIKEQINDWGLADTEVREQIYAYLQQNPI